MDLILGIETSGQRTQCCLGRNQDGSAEILASLEDTQPQKHCENLAPMISKALADAQVEMGDLNLVVIDLGPGLYTGLRVGITTAIFLAYGLGIPVMGFSSLEQLAYQAFSAGGHSRVITVMDARRNEVFYGGFENGMSTFLEAGVLKPEELADLLATQASQGDTIPYENTVLYGDGATLYKDIFSSLSAVEICADLPSAESLVHLAVKMPQPETNLQPVYLRRPDVF